MANTYEAIATVTVGGGGAATMAFSSIPATYTDLAVLCSLRLARSNTYSQARAYFNSNTSNYSWRALLHDGFSSPAASSTNGTDVAYWYPPAANATASTFGNDLIYIPNYAGSNKKSYSIDSVPENNSTTAYIAGLWAALWDNTAAITSITLDSPISDTFLEYSTATLYGIKNS